MRGRTPIFHASYQGMLFQADRRFMRIFAFAIQFPGGLSNLEVNLRFYTISFPCRQLSSSQPTLSPCFVPSVLLLLSPGCWDGLCTDESSDLNRIANKTDLPSRTFFFLTEFVTSVSRFVFSCFTD